MQQPPRRPPQSRPQKRPPPRRAVYHHARKRARRVRVPQAQRSYPAQQRAQGPRPPHAPPARRKASRWNSTTLLTLGLGATVVVVGLCLCMGLAAIGLWSTSGEIMPGVSAAGVDLGGMSEAEAAAALDGAWQNGGILLRDGARAWRVSPAELGVRIDARATAANAAAWGRSDGGPVAWLGSLAAEKHLDPVLAVDLSTASSYLQARRAVFELEPVNAGVRLINGQAVASPAENGRALDIPTTLERLRTHAARELADGALDLVMIDTRPAILDASPLVAQANALLASPFTVEGYDPIRDEWHQWSAPPEVWAGWIQADAAADGAGGLRLSLHPAGPRAFLEANARFADERYIALDDAVGAMRAALAQNQTSATIRVWHGETTYTVRAGQTLSAIAEEVGIPYPYIQAANRDKNTNAMLIGEVLKIPSRDILVPLDPVPHKRIIVSRSQQHLWAYENGQVVFDWVISTGIASSPTALGVFQVQQHELNAYAAQWNLYMPHFMGFYHPGPNMDLWNGFHGFPTRGGGYLLWTGDLGHPVTYGCVLLSLENAETLYNWAEEGVVVEIRG